MKIKILNQVKLKKDLTEYSDDTNKNMRVYRIGEVVDFVNEKYRSRFEKAKNSIEILGCDEKEEDILENYQNMAIDVTKMTKKELIKFAEEKLIEIDPSDKKIDILEAVNDNIR